MLKSKSRAEAGWRFQQQKEDVARDEASEDRKGREVDVGQQEGRAVSSEEFLI